MNYYKIVYSDGAIIFDKAERDIDIIKRYDLATREHIKTRVIRLEGEQRAIAQANEQE